VDETSAFAGYNPTASCSTNSRRSSRLVQASYVGGPDLEPSLSGAVTEVVPAKINLLRLDPSRVAGGGSVRITGQLDGGYLPPGGALVRLRVGSGTAYSTDGVQDA
jgi:hypothetical protein